jgi:hypothetical protein
MPILPLFLASAEYGEECLLRMSTLPIWYIRRLPFFCFSSSLRLRVTSPPVEWIRPRPGEAHASRGQLPHRALLRTYLHPSRPGWSNSGRAQGGNRREARGAVRSTASSLQLLREFLRNA